MPAITLTVSTGDANRLAAALGTELNLGRSATLAEIKTHLVSLMKHLVQQREREAAQVAANATVQEPAEITVT